MILIAFQPDEILQIRVFDNLLDRFTVRQLQAFLNDKRPKGDTYGNRFLSTKRFAEGLGILFLCICPRYQLSQLDPAIFFIQLAAKRQEEIIGEKQLVFTMIDSIHTDSGTELPLLILDSDE